MSDESRVVAMLASLAPRLRPKSLASLEMAATARRSDGVDGILVISIPADNKKPVEMWFTTAPSKLISGG